MVNRHHLETFGLIRMQYSTRMGHSEAYSRGLFGGFRALGLSKYSGRVGCDLIGQTQERVLLAALPS